MASPTVWGPFRRCSRAEFRRYLLVGGGGTLACAWGTLAVAACGSSHGAAPGSLPLDGTTTEEAAPSDSGGSLDATMMTGIGATDGGANSADAAGVLDADGSGPATNGAPMTACPGNIVCDDHCVPPSDIHHCGSCTVDCADLPNIAATGLACVAGRCVYQCVPGSADCADAGSGCVDDLTGSSQCGSCGVACDGGSPLCAPTADASAFQCTETCPAWAMTACSGTCVDTSSSPGHCGNCNAPCQFPTANAHATCVAGSCSQACNPSYSSCGSACVDLTSDPAHCGTCDDAGCAEPMQCQQGACVCTLMCGGNCVDPQIDSNNCGACGHDCLGGACSGGACQPIAFASGLSSPWCLAVDSSGVYWTDYGDGTVMRVGLDGSGLATLASGLSMPYGITVDSTSAYFIQTNIASLLKVPKTPVDAGAVTLVAGTFENQYRALAVDSTRVYWADDGNNGGIFAVGLDGGAPSGITGGSPDAICHLMLDSSRVYWLAYPGQDAIESAPLDGGANTILWEMASNVGDVWGIALDDNRLYWTQFTRGSVWSLLLDGGIPNLITTGGSAFAIAADSQRIYWSGAGTVLSAPVGGGPITILASGLALPNDIALDDQAIYWVDRGNGTVMKLAK